MKGTCIECNEVKFLQNKKGQCGECVYKKNHKGKSREEVYQERAEEKQKKNYTTIKTQFKTIRIPNSHFVVDEESAKNERNQNEAERREKEEGYFGILPPWKDEERVSKPNKKRKSVKKISTKQLEINRLYKLTCIDMDHVTEPVCTGCLKYQGGDIKLSHSHIISREDCKRIGRPELIYDRDNLTYHCLDFGENIGCHGKWENPVKRIELGDYIQNMKYIKSINGELFQKYSS